MIKRRFVFILILFLCACREEREIIPYDLPCDNGVSIEMSSNFVSFDQAIKNAEFVYRDIEGLRYKKRRIQDVDLLTRNDIMSTGITRSIDQDEPLAYIVNYENNEGYAILAAQVDSPPILMLGDEGTFSLDEFESYVSGNATRSSVEINSVQELQYQMVVNSLNLVVPGVTHEQQVVTTDTTVVLKCLPLIPVRWGQGAPYNMYCSNASGVICPAGCVPVACAQILASLCYHHNFRPSIDIHEDYPVDWYTINRLIFTDTVKYNSGDDTPGSRMVATLMRGIGEDVHAVYTPKETNATLVEACALFEKLDLNNVQCLEANNVSIDTLFEYIVRDNLPIGCYASRLPESGSAKWHMFVIDGWLRLEYSMNSFGHLVDGNVVLEPDNRQQRFDLVHVNFGWDGRCDGYYLPGSFDTSLDEYDEYDEDFDADSGISYNYNLGVLYMLYNL